MSAAQLDLFAKPYHSVQVMRLPMFTNAGRSIVVRYDNATQMRDDAERVMTAQANGAQARIAYIQLCMHYTDDKTGRDRIRLLDTVYPEDF